MTPLHKEITAPDGTRMRYRVSGCADGRPMILMHGWGCTGKTVESIERVAGESCRVYTVDFPGHGESDEPHTLWGVEEYTRQIEQLVQAEGIERPILLGHSFGGRVGILYSSRHADVSKLILTDAAGIKPAPSGHVSARTKRYRALRRMAETLLPKALASKAVDRLRVHFGSADYKAATPAMRPIFTKIVNEDLTDRLSLIQAPTLLIWGDKDTATPLADARKMEAAIPDAGLVVFEGCGHYSFLDAPARYAAVLRSFLQS